MHILAFLLMASCVPAPATAHAKKILAAHKADPEHWQTTALPPIAMPGEPFWITRSRVEEEIEEQIKKITAETKRIQAEIERHRELEKRLHEDQPNKP